LMMIQLKNQNLRVFETTFQTGTQEGFTTLFFCIIRS
jgi:hypothetical protein